MQALGLATLLGTSSVGCSSNYGENKQIVANQPDINVAQFKKIALNESPAGFCGDNEYWQLQADRVVLGDQAEAIYKEGFEDAMAGKIARSKNEIKTKVLELFDAAYKEALKAAAAKSKEAGLRVYL